MLKRIICTVLLLLVSFGFSMNGSAADRYKWITSTDKVTISYDTQTVRYNSNYGKTVDVWVAWYYTEDGASEQIKNHRNDGWAKESKWDNFSYELNHMLINSNHQFDCYEVIYYDINGNVLDSVRFKHEWDNVIPGSIGEGIYNTFSGFLKS